MVDSVFQSVAKTGYITLEKWQLCRLKTFKLWWEDSLWVLCKRREEIGSSALWTRLRQRPPRRGFAGSAVTGADMRRGERKRRMFQRTTPRYFTFKYNQAQWQKAFTSLWSYKGFGVNRLIYIYLFCCLFIRNFTISNKNTDGLLVLASSAIRSTHFPSFHGIK